MGDAVQYMGCRSCVGTCLKRVFIMTTLALRDEGLWNGRLHLIASLCIYLDELHFNSLSHVSPTVDTSLATSTLTLLQFYSALIYPTLFYFILLLQFGLFFLSSICLLNKSIQSPEKRRNQRVTVKKILPHQSLNCALS